MTFDPTKAKSIVQSKTFWGALIALFAVLFPSVFHKLGLSNQDYAMYADKIVGGVGSLFAIYGRLVASQPVTITGASSN